MAFKPLTSSKTALINKEPSAKELAKKAATEAVKVEEKIYIIYDDSSSMSAFADSSVQRNYNNLTNLTPNADTRIKLAAEGTIDYMKNCKPHSTQVEIAPLNAEALALTKNLPLLATSIKTVEASGGTPLFAAVGKLVDKHKSNKLTRALIFTDGDATDERYIEYNRPSLMEEVQAMGIPIDLILIGAKVEFNLTSNERMLKQMSEKSGGTFLICKDAADFKKKMKFFAPLLRHMLPSIASGDSRGDS